MNVSDLIGKPVFSTQEKELGYVKDVYLNKNKKRIATLACVNGEEEEFFLPAQAIQSMEEYVTAAPSRKQKPSGLPSPVGKRVYSSQGAYLGEVTDYVFAEKYALVITRLRGVNLCFPAENALWKDALIITEKRNRPRVASLPPKEVLKGETPCSGEQMHAVDLLGRKAKREVESEKGELLVGEGERITPDIIRKAAKCNRLLELTASAVMN